MDLTPEKLRLIPMVALIVIGCFGLLNSKTMLRSLLSLDVIDTATISIFVLIAASAGSQTPIVTASRYSSYSDPYPQAIILSSELALARENGFSAMRLGPRVLRTETAPLVALSVLGARWGDINA